MPNAEAQVAEFLEASKVNPNGKFTNIPCLVKEQFVYRIEVFEKPRLQALVKKNNLPLRMIVNIWSMPPEGTGECHCFPIFSTDNLTDLINRYADLFPVEIKQYMKELSDYNAVLKEANAMSGMKNMMHKLKLPIGLHCVIKNFDKTFFDYEKNYNLLIRMFPKLCKVGRPKGTV